MNQGIKIEVYQQDWIPGFAAFIEDGSIQEDAKAHVVLNLGACLLAVKDGGIDKKDLPYMIAETLMHEVIHVLESWARVEFNEDKVDELIVKYERHVKANAELSEMTPEEIREFDSLNRPSKT